jgi:IMP dehydrogenase/GMP reductase
MFVQGYTFDDVLLIPKHSTVGSREEVDLSVSLPKGIQLKIPLVSANMSSVTSKQMATTIASLGGLAILHRFDDYRQLLINFNQASSNSIGFPGAIGASVGIKTRDMAFVHDLNNDGCNIICVDVAHGDHEKVAEFVSIIHANYPHILIIAGNVVTAKGADLLWNAGADIIKIGVGPGCFAAGTRILMANGTYKNIEDIKPGDRIIDGDGNPQCVKRSFSTGKRIVSKIRNSIFYEDTLVTSDHKYFLADMESVSESTIHARGYASILLQESKTTPKCSKLKWQEIGKSKRIALLMPRYINFELNEWFECPIFIRDGGNWRMPTKKKLDFCITPTYDTGYIFGTFLGDGTAHVSNNGKSNTGAVHWYFGLNEIEIANKLSSAVKNITGRDLKIKLTKNIIICSLYHKPMAEFLAKFSKKNNKHLPSQYLVNNKDYLSGIWDGLISSDGCLSNGRISFSNTSNRLIELFDVTTYLLTGIFPNNEKRKPSIGGLVGADIKSTKISYIGRINKTGSKRLFYNYQVSKMLEFVDTNIDSEVFDLEIDCETHSFIANNAIVHNSLCTTRIETGNGYPQLSALDIVCNNNDYSVRDTGTCSQWPMFIADGGIKSAGDCVKALAFADLVMIGNLFAGTEEAPGEIICFQGKQFKRYAGSSTHKQNHIEGVVGLVPYKGSVSDIVLHLVEGIKSGCSYQGSNNLTDLKADPHFVVISNAGLIESHPHNVIL